MEQPDNDTVYFMTTEQAAKFIGSTTRALLCHVQRGTLKPDIWGGRGAFKSHRFTRETILKFAHRGRKSA